MAPNLILVGADKGGVGKTTVTRAILDYLVSRGTSFRAFDTEVGSEGLRRFRPEAVQADVGVPKGQMAILDGLDEGSGAYRLEIRKPGFAPGTLDNTLGQSAYLGVITLASAAA